MPSPDVVAGSTAFPSCAPVSLKDSGGWGKLAQEIDGAAAKGIGTGTTRSLIRHLREVLGVQSYLLEERYIDRDYSADYLYFYARVFRDYDRYCKRIHFFSEDISELFNGEQSSVSDALKELQRLAEGHYCGFCVLRPLPHARIGRTVLKAVNGEISNSSSYSSSVTCRAKFRVNLCGVDLEVTGSAFLQQDARVGACAQVAIWVGMRHMHARHGCNWVSVADITKYAEPITESEAASLPAGSNCLSTDAMIRAIHNVGYQPLHFYKHDKKADDGIVNNIGHDIFPYVESGIPVILGWDYNSVIRKRKVASHAVTVIGRVLAKPTNVTKNEYGYIDAHTYVGAYIVHDDQAGPYMLLPMSNGNGKELDKSGMSEKLGSSGLIKRRDVAINVGEHAHTAMVLMSPRVFSTAAAAEHAAWDRIKSVLCKVKENYEEQQKCLPENLQQLLKKTEDDSFCISDRIVLRTYLSSVAGYRRHLAGSSASDKLKRAMLVFHLPHFVWVTEISTVDSYNSTNGKCRVYGHVVTDATSSRSTPLALHLPGLLLVDCNFNKSREVTTKKSQKIGIVDDKPYERREKKLESRH